MTAGLLAHRVDGPAGAPPVVLLHAIATHSAIWLPQLGAWSSAFRLVRIDLPGHGASGPPVGAPTLAAMAGQVAAVLDRLDIPAASIVGLSLGGMVAQAFALAWPERTRALVLAHTSGRTEAPVREIWERRLQQSGREGLAAQAEATLDRWFTRAFAQASPLTMAWVARQIRETTPAGYAAAVRAIQGLDHLDRLAALRMPTLVVAGADDAAVPPAMASQLAGCIPGARLHVLEHAAHLGNVQQPVAFTEAVGGFLQENTETKETS